VGASLERQVYLNEYLVPVNIRNMINRGLTNTKNLTEEEKLSMEKLR